MQTVPGSENQVTFSDILDLASWERPRSDEELQQFVAARHETLPEFADIDIL